MVSKIFFWAGFGIFTPRAVLHSLLRHYTPGLAVRFWQLGIEMRPFFHPTALWGYPVFAAVGGSFGYWLTDVHSRQLAIMNERKSNLMDKRKRRAEREGVRVDAAVGAPVRRMEVEEKGVLASTS